MGELRGAVWRLFGLVAVLALAGCAAAPTGGVATSTSDTPATTSQALGSAGGLPSDRPAADQEPLPAIEHPTKADIAVVGPLPDRFLGRADAPVTVIEYASLTCPHCSAFQRLYFEQVKKAYIDTGKVRWVLREFPIGHTSGAAWIVNRCAPEAMYFKLYDTFMRNQPEWVSLEVRPDAIAAVAGKAGLSRAQFNACWQNPATDAGLRWIKARARQLGVSGTPTFFIGETKVRGVPNFEDFGAMIEAELQSPGSSLQVAIVRQLVPKPTL